MKNILIIGGSRFVGPLIVEKLRQRGHRVTVFNRGRARTEYPRGVEFVRGDRNDGFEIHEHFDAVIDMCAYNGLHTRRALEDLRFDFFVHMSTVAVYQKSEIFPLTENSPLGDWPLWGDMNAGKVECERTLTESGIRFSAIRPAYILGPNNYLNRECFIYEKIVREEPIILPGNGEAITRFISAADAAEAITLIAENKIAGAFNCAGDDAVTLKGFVQMLAEIAGKEPVLRCNAYADGIRFNPQEFPFANENSICANDKAKRHGICFTPLADFLRKDYETHYKRKTAP